MVPLTYLAANVIKGTEWDGVFSDQCFENITIQWHGLSTPDPNEKAWSIRYKSFVVSKSLCVSYEPQPSSRTKAFLKAYRHTLADATDIATRFIKVARRDTVADMKRRHGSADDARKRIEAITKRDRTWSN